MSEFRFLRSVSNVTCQSAEECSPVKFTPTSFFLANGRVELATSAPLKAGQPNELTLVLHGPPIGCIRIEETAFGGSVDETSHSVSIHRRSDGSQYALFTPVNMGKVGVRLGRSTPTGDFRSWMEKLMLNPRIANLQL